MCSMQETSHPSNSKTGIDGDPGYFDTLIISDVHLGSEISRAQSALKLLKAGNFRRLILLGDIFSDLNFRRLKKEHWEFLSCIRKLSNPRRRIEVVWVEGNHDHGLSNLMSHLVGIRYTGNTFGSIGECVTSQSTAINLTVL